MRYVAFFVSCSHAPSDCELSFCTRAYGNPILLKCPLIDFALAVWTRPLFAFESASRDTLRSLFNQQTSSRSFPFVLPHPPHTPPPPPLQRHVNQSLVPALAAVAPAALIGRSVGRGESNYQHHPVRIPLITLHSCTPPSIMPFLNATFTSAIAC